MISALAFDLMDESFKRGGSMRCDWIHFRGCRLYRANWLLARKGARDRNVPVSNNPLKVTTQGAD
jgi:hypothetical protein